MHRSTDHLVVSPEILKLSQEDLIYPQLEAILANPRMAPEELGRAATESASRSRGLIPTLQHYSTDKAVAFFDRLGEVGKELQPMLRQPGKLDSFVGALEETFAFGTPEIHEATGVSKDLRSFVFQLVRRGILAEREASGQTVPNETVLRLLMSMEEMTLSRHQGVSLENHDYRMLGNLSVFLPRIPAGSYLTGRLLSQRNAFLHKSNPTSRLEHAIDTLHIVSNWDTTRPEEFRGAPPEARALGAAVAGAAFQGLYTDLQKDLTVALKAADAISGKRVAESIRASITQLRQLSQDGKILIGQGHDGQLSSALIDRMLSMAEEVKRNFEGINFEELLLRYYDTHTEEFLAEMAQSIRADFDKDLDEIKKNQQLPTGWKNFMKELVRQLSGDSLMIRLREVHAYLDIARALQRE